MKCNSYAFAVANIDVCLTYNKLTPSTEAAKKDNA